MYSLLKRYREPLLVGLLLLAPLLSFLTSGHRGREPNIVDRVVLAVTAPVQSGLTWVVTSVGDSVSGYVALRGAHQEAAECRGQLAEARAELNSLKEEQLENQRLRQALGYTQATVDEEIMARLIGVNPSPQFQSVRIDRGESDGVRVGMAVVTPVMSAAGVPQGVVIGQVFRVVGGSADIMLVTDPASRIGVIVQRTRVRGSAVGAGDGQRLALEYVRREEDVVEGDVVVTAGTDGVFPRGLLVGAVKGFQRPTTGMFLSAQVLPSVDVHKIEEVFVIPTAPTPSALLGTEPAAPKPEAPR